MGGTERTIVQERRGCRLLPTQRPRSRRAVRSVASCHLGHCRRWRMGMGMDTQYVRAFGWSSSSPMQHPATWWEQQQNARHCHCVAAYGRAHSAIAASPDREAECRYRWALPRQPGTGRRAADEQGPFSRFSSLEPDDQTSSPAKCDPSDPPCLALHCLALPCPALPYLFTGSAFVRSRQAGTL